MKTVKRAIKLLILITALSHPLLSKAQPTYGQTMPYSAFAPKNTTPIATWEVDEIVDPENQGALFNSMLQSSGQSALTFQSQEQQSDTDSGSASDRVVIPFQSADVLTGNTSFKVVSPGSQRTFTIPNISGEMSILGQIIDNSEIAPDAVELGEQTTGAYQEDTDAGSGISVSGTEEEGWSPEVSLGPLTENWLQSGAYDLVLDNKLSQLQIKDASDSYYATVDVGALASDGTYTISGASGALLTDTNFFDLVDTGALVASNNLSDLPDPSAARANLSLGSMALQDAGNISITGGTIDGVTIGSSNPVALSASTVNGLAIPTVSNSTFTLADNVDFQVDNSLTFSGSDSTSFSFPNNSGTVATLDATQTITNKTISGTSNTLEDVSLSYVNTSIPAGNTIVNTTDPAAFESSHTFPADSISSGDVIKLKLWGIYSSSVVAPSFQKDVKLGDTIIASTGTIGSGGVVNAGWSAEIYIVIHQDGASGVADSQGFMEFSTAATTALFIGSPNTGTWSIDTTVPLTLTAEVDWGTATTSNSITLRQMVVEHLK